MSRSVAVALSVLLLAGCTSLTQPAAYQATDYTAVPPVSMNVGAVLVDSVYVSPGMSPNIDQNLLPTPQDALRTAILQHYQSGRPDGSGVATLRFTIKDASVIENELKPDATTLLGQTISKTSNYNYSGHLEVESKTEGAARQNGYVHAEAHRTVDVKSGSTAERARAVHALVQQMVDDVMQQLEQQINANMDGFIISGGDMTIMPVTSGRWDHVREDRVSRSAGMRVITVK